MAQVFIANYGARNEQGPLMPIEADDATATWLDNTLRESVKRDNLVTWAQNQLRIMADMATDRELKWVADEATRIKEGLEQTNDSSRKSKTEER
jgi:hypothetical protein